MLLMSIAGEKGRRQWSTKALRGEPCCNAPNFELNFFLSLSLAKFGRYLSFLFLFAKTLPISKTPSSIIIINPKSIFIWIVAPCQSLHIFCLWIEFVKTCF
jgi:hypothetical protein